MKKILGYITFLFFLMFLMTSEGYTQTNATGYVDVKATRSLGNSNFSVLYANFSSPTLPAGATITGIYPVAVATFNCMGTGFISAYGTTLGLGNTSSNFLGTPSTCPFTNALLHGPSIGTSMSLLATQQIQIGTYSTLDQDYLIDTENITGIGYAIYYTGPTTTISGQLPAPVSVPIGTGIAWSMPTTLTATGFQPTPPPFPACIFCPGGGNSYGSIGNPNPVGYESLIGDIQIPDAENFNGTMTISLQKIGIKNICNYPYNAVPTTQVNLPVVNGTPVGLSSGYYASQDCMSPRIPYFVSLIDKNNKMVSQDNWYVPNVASGVVNIGDMQEQKFNGPIAVAIPQGIVSAPAGNQVITQLAGTSLTIYGTVNFAGTVAYTTPPAFNVIKANQILVNGVSSSSYPLDVNGIINASSGYCVASCTTAQVGQSLIYNGTAFVPGYPNVVFPNLYYQSITGGGVAAIKRTTLAFGTGLTVADGGTQTNVTLATVGTAGTYTSVGSISVNSFGQVTGVGASTASSRGTFTLPAGSIGPYALITYNSGITVSTSAVLGCTIASGTINPVMIYNCTVSGGTIKMYVGNSTGGGTAYYGSLNINYLIQ